MARKKTAETTASTETFIPAPKAAPKATRTPRVTKPRTEFEEKMVARTMALDFLDQNPSALSYDFLVENQLPIYVKNNLRVPGKIAFSVKNGDGRHVSIEIANTSIPQRLDDLLTWGALSNAHLVKDCLRQGTILLCSPRAAEKELQSDYAKSKSADLQRSKFAAMRGSFSQMMSTNSSDMKGIEDSLSTYAIQRRDTTTVTASTATNKMEAIINRFLDGSRTEEATISEVMDNARIFDPSDWHMLISKVQGRSQKLVDLANQHLAIQR